MVHQDIQSLLDSIESTKNAIEKGDQEAAEKYGWEMCNHCDKVMDSITEKDYSPEMCKLQLVSMATLLDLHIMRNDPIDIAIFARQFIDKYMADVRHIERTKQLTSAFSQTIISISRLLIRYKQRKDMLPSESGDMAGSAAKPERMYRPWRLLTVARYSF